jgi:predicted AAA+ superfamily ATPase
MENLPWGTDSELTEKQFYNRENDIDYIKNLLNTTGTSSPPTIMMPGIRGVGKTVLLKKIKKELESEYLVSYIDLTQSYSYQSGKLTEIGLMHQFYKSLMDSSKEKNFNTLIKNIKKKFTTRKFKIDSIADVGGYPIPIPESEEDYEKLLNFVLNLPQKIYNDHSNDLKGVIMIIDEFQALKDLENNLDSFLWFFRSVIQNQKNVAYVFSGSINSKDTIIERISGQMGAFGGRMLTIEINPFTKETVHNYLNEKLPSLNLENDGFERFYNCTKGIPHYVNTFANLLPKNRNLGDKEVIEEFQKILPILADHLKQEWGSLNLSEQKIIGSLINQPLRRKDLAKSLERTSSSLSKPLNKLQNIDLINNDKGVYSISQPILKSWLKQEYKNRGIFPFRNI